MTPDIHRYSKCAPALLAIALLFLLAACAAKPGIHTTAEQSAYNTYNNARFGYSICYPPDQLVPQGEPDNSDGQRFLSKDGRAIVLVFGSHNALNKTLRDIQQSEIERFKGLDGSFKPLDTQVTGTTSILEGTSDTQDYYEKVVFSGDTIFTFIAQYPKKDVSTFEPIVSHMADCFLVFPQAR
ncbi:MAG TPA: hypothetical protein VNX46_14855 [Candidatus Acidoferrum sp.]|jgi:hypothetical protein|nr:hypothetical protein [Candidatus Acidoferrum sp.]